MIKERLIYFVPAVLLGSILAGCAIGIYSDRAWLIERITNEGLGKALVAGPVVAVFLLMCFAPLFGIFFALCYRIARPLRGGRIFEEDPIDYTREMF